MPKLTTHTRNHRIFTRYNLGEKVTDLAKIYHLSRGGIYFILRAKGAALRARGRLPGTPASNKNIPRAKQIMKLCQKGHTFTEIAQVIGTTRQYVHQVFHRETSSTGA